MNHHLDIGVISYLPEERELEAVEFYRDSLVLVVWPGHRLAKRREVDIGELGQETFVAHIVESPYRQRVVQMFARYRVPLQMHIELPTVESIKLFVEMKNGITIVPRMCVEHEVAEGDLQELRIRQMRVVRKLSVVLPQRPASNRRGTGACCHHSNKALAPPNRATRAPATRPASPLAAGRRVSLIRQSFTCSTARATITGALVEGSIRINPTMRRRIVCVPVNAESPLRLMNFVPFPVSTVSGLGSRIPAVH